MPLAFASAAIAAVGFEKSSAASPRWTARALSNFARACATPSLNSAAFSCWPVRSYSAINASHAASSLSGAGRAEHRPSPGRVGSVKSSAVAASSFFARASAARLLEDSSSPYTAPRSNMPPYALSFARPTRRNLFNSRNNVSTSLAVLDPASTTSQAFSRSAMAASRSVVPLDAGSVRNAARKYKAAADAGSTAKAQSQACTAVLCSFCFA